MRRGRIRALACVLAAATPLCVLLVGCAPEAVPGWEPPPARVIPGVSLADPSVADPADPAAPDPAGEGADQLVSPVEAPPVAAPAAGLDATSLGLVPGRLRNDALAFAARYVLIPGAPAFNERVDGLLRSAIAATGLAYAPQAYPAGSGLADRGCVPGSAVWPAAEVLSRPETGPVGGVGIAVTCELTAAFGHTIGVTLRVVTGGPDGVAGDETHALLVDVSTGAVTEGMNRWSEAAPDELWRRAVELLRQRAGGLSTAPVAEPDETQLALAADALRTAMPDPANPADGGLLVVLAPGIASPELAGLDIEATAEALPLIVDAETALEWTAPEWRALAEQAGQPFAGVPAPATSVPIDCSLVPCVALTYDDGPSGYTPQLLDALAAQRASATFFLIGSAVPGGADTVRRTVAEGHEVASHTMSHPDLTTLSAAAARAQVRDAAALIEQTAGVPVTMFRPPYGAVNAAVIDAVGMPAILWSVDTNDWRRPGVDVLIDRAVNGVSPGGIVLFHDTHLDSVTAAPAIVEGLRDRGFEPVTVSELFGGSVPAGRVSSR